jgi:hypothetical protein
MLLTLQLMNDILYLLNFIQNLMIHVHQMKCLGSPCACLTSNYKHYVFILHIFM